VRGVARGNAYHVEVQPPRPFLFHPSSRGGENMTRLATRIAAALSGIIAIVLAGGAHWKS
jgi:hypothetical protein